MEVNKERLAASWKYVIVAYIVFGIMVLGICGTASMVFHVSPVTMRVLSNVCAWSPTIVLFVWFRKWQSEGTIKAFLKRAFSKKLKLQWVIIIHLFFNLPYCFLNAYIRFYVIMMVIYPIEAAIFLGYRR